MKELSDQEKDFRWVRSVVISATNEFQLECCENLLKAFLRKHIYSRGALPDFFSLTDTWMEQRRGLLPLPAESKN